MAKLTKSLFLEIRYHFQEIFYHQNFLFLLFIFDLKNSQNDNISPQFPNVPAGN